jgi:hypothetical protein
LIAWISICSMQFHQDCMMGNHQIDHLWAQMIQNHIDWSFSGIHFASLGRVMNLRRCQRIPPITSELPRVHF